MSGHSKWSTIKHKKAINDAKKGKIFSKLAQQISIAARDGGGDPNVNFSLRLLMDKARAVSMPAENVKRAVDRGTGKGGEAYSVEHVMYEGFGPDGVSVIVETITDNRNRTVADMRGAFNDNNGNLGESGSVSWNFDQKGFVEMRPAVTKKSEKFGAEDEVIEKDQEEVMLQLMEVDGILDIVNEKGEDSDGKEYTIFELYTDPKMLGAVRDHVNELGYIIQTAELIWMPKNYKDADHEKVENFIEAIEEFDEVQNIYTDAKHD